MRMRSWWLAAACAGLVLASCGGHEQVVGSAPVPIAPPDSGERLLWSSTSGRPPWTLEEPDVEGGYRYFVGLSSDFATENLARDDALRSASTRAVTYLGTLARDRFERARTTFGLSSSVVDPTESSRQFERQLSMNIAKQVKPKEWYVEQWQKPTGYSYRVFVLARMPLESADRSLRATAEDNVRRAQLDAKAAADEVAKRQAEAAAEFWSKIKEQGLLDE